MTPPVPTVAAAHLAPGRAPAEGLLYQPCFKERWVLILQKHGLAVEVAKGSAVLEGTCGSCQSGL